MLPDQLSFRRTAAVFRSSYLLFPGTVQPQNSLQAFSASLSLLFLFSLRFLFTSSCSPVLYVQSLSSTESSESVDEVEEVEPQDVRRKSGVGVVDWALQSLEMWWLGTGGADGAGGEDADARSERVNNRNAESAISLSKLKISRKYI